jgi:hypothetical protein
LEKKYKIKNKIYILEYAYHTPLFGLKRLNRLNDLKHEGT